MRSRGTYLGASSANDGSERNELISQPQINAQRLRTPCRSHVLEIFVTERTDPEYGRGTVEISEGVPSSRFGLKLKERLVATFRAPDYRPPMLPAVATELLSLSRQPRVSVAQITKLLSQDAILAGEVLKMAQSAALAGGGGPPTLDAAIVRLGLSRVTDLFFRAAMEMRVFRAPGYDKPMKTLQRHSTLVAELSRLVCRHSIGFDDYAYLCGLLHDVGTAAAIVALAEARDMPDKPEFTFAWPVLKEIHASCGEIVARLWKLPPDVKLVIRLHHQVEAGGHAHPVAAAVFIADCLAAQCGVAFEDEGLMGRLPQVARGIGLSERDLERLQNHAQQLMLGGELLSETA